MSVTFAIESYPVGTFSATCHESGPVATRVTREELAVAQEAHIKECSECAHYGLFGRSDMDVEGVEHLEVNLANTNARMILDRIGIDAGLDLMGEHDAADFAGHALVALGTLSAEADAAVPATEVYPGQPGATVIDCGTPEGYTSDVLSRLIDLAVEATRQGRKVWWG